MSGRTIEERDGQNDLATDRMCCKCDFTRESFSFPKDGCVNLFWVPMSYRQNSAKEARLRTRPRTRCLDNKMGGENVKRSLNCLVYSPKRARNHINITDTLL